MKEHIDSIKAKWNAHWKQQRDKFANKSAYDRMTHMNKLETWQTSTFIGTSFCSGVWVGSHGVIPFLLTLVGAGGAVYLSKCHSEYSKAEQHIGGETTEVTASTSTLPIENDLDLNNRQSNATANTTNANDSETNNETPEEQFVVKQADDNNNQTPTSGSSN